MIDTSLEGLGAAAILPKPVRPSELFNTLVEIAAGGGQRNLRHEILRHKAQAATPQFAARILVAEDNPVNQEVAVGILETMGCEIVSALNGEIAVRLFAETRFDLIFMDCEMPVMDGIAATRCIREREAASGASHRTPIIALTAHALNEVRDKCLAAGMDDFLIKPYDARQMAQTLLRWLGATHDAAASEPCPAAPPQAASAAIDDSVIEGLRALDRKGGPSRLVRAVSRFLEVAPALAASVKAAADNGDAEALWRAAHSLKSSAAALGAQALSKRCAEIEARVQQRPRRGAAAGAGARRRFEGGNRRPRSPDRGDPCPRLTPTAAISAPPS